MTDAYRNVKFKGISGSEVEGKLLFDTGATTNLIAINHPILSNAELQPLPSKIKVNEDYTFINLGAAQSQSETDGFVGRFDATLTCLTTIMEKYASQIQALYTECAREIEIIKENMPTVCDHQ